MKCEFCGADKDSYYETLGSSCCEKQHKDYPEIPQYILKLLRLARENRNK